MRDGIIPIWLWAGILIIMIWLIAWSANQAEQVECYQLQRQSEQYPGFYLTHWQKQQCDRWEVEIDAPVR